VLNGVRRVRPMPGEVAVIHSAGAVGLLFLAVLGAGGVRCVVAEPVALRREAARLMGAAATVDPATAYVRATVSALQPGGADLAVDAVGSQFGAAVAEVRPGGGVLLFGMNSQARSAIAFRIPVTGPFPVTAPSPPDWPIPPTGPSPHWPISPDWPGPPPTAPANDRYLPMRARTGQIGPWPLACPVPSFSPARERSHQGGSG
jgi:Zinc-binding dehydrogenase